MTNDWSVEKTEDIQEVDEEKKPSYDAAIKDTDKAREPHVPGEGRGSSGEHEEQPDHDKETAP